MFADWIHSEVLGRSIGWWIYNSSCLPSAGFTAKDHPQCFNQKLQWCSLHYLCKLLLTQGASLNCYFFWSGLLVDMAQIWAISGQAQGLFSALHPEVIPSGIQRTTYSAGIKPGSALCKARTLLSVLAFDPSDISHLVLQRPTNL